MTIQTLISSHQVNDFTCNKETAVSKRSAFHLTMMHLLGRPARRQEEFTAPVFVQTKLLEAASYLTSRHENDTNQTLGMLSELPSFLKCPTIA